MKIVGNPNCLINENLSKEADLVILGMWIKTPA